MVKKKNDNYCGVSVNTTKYRIITIVVKKRTKCVKLEALNEGRFSLDWDKEKQDDHESLNLRG